MKVLWRDDDEPTQPSWVAYVLIALAIALYLLACWGPEWL